MNDKKLSVKTKLLFGSGDFGMQVLTAFIQFCQLAYDTDVCGIQPGLAGTAILVGKLSWDMINDILFGWLEDRTKSKLGRRRPYLIFCAVPLMLTFWLMLSLPTGMSNVKAFFAIIGTALLFDTFSTLVTTAYSAMTAELTVDYNERTSVATYRMMFNIAGYLLGAAASFLLGDIIISTFGVTKQQAYSIMGLFFGFLACLSSLIVGLFVTNKPAVESEPSTIPAFKAILSVFKNKPFNRYMFINLFMSCAFTVVMTVVSYYIFISLNLTGSFDFLITVGVMMVVLSVCIIPCSKVVMKIGKAKTYALGLGIASVALLAGTFITKADSGNTSLTLMAIIAVAAVAGVGFSSQWVCPHSMIPDVVEYDELMTGERREGLYYGVNCMVGKVSGALGSAIVGWILEFGGYDSTLPMVSQIMTMKLDYSIRFLFGILPAALLFICIPLLMKYPITKESHAAVLEELRKRKESKVKLV